MILIQMHGLPYPSISKNTIASRKFSKISKCYFEVIEEKDSGFVTYQSNTNLHLLQKMGRTNGR